MKWCLQSFCVIASALCVLASSCGTSKRISENSREEVRYMLKDSVVTSDSVVMVYETNYRDSTVIRDSIVVKLDCEGNVVEKERWYSKENSRDRHSDSAKAVSRDKESHHKEAESKKSTEQKTVYVETPGKLRWWQLGLMWLGGLCFASTVVLSVMMVRQRR